MKINQGALRTSLKLFLAFGLIVWLIEKKAIDFSILLKLSSPVPLLLIISLTALGLIFNNWRWLLLMRSKSIAISFRSSFSLTLIGLFWNFAMPGGVGGDVVKGYYLMKENAQLRMAAMTTLIMDRLIGVFAMLLTSLVACLLQWNWMWQKPSLRALVLALLLVFAGYFLAIVVAFLPHFKRSQRLRQWAHRLPFGETLYKFYDTIHDYRNRSVVLFQAMALSFLAQISTILCFVVVAQVLNLSVPFMGLLVVVPLGVISTALPIAPAGIGVGQAAFFVLFKLYLGFEVSLGPTGVTMIQLSQFLLGLIGAYLYFRRRPSAHPSSN